MNLKEVIQKGYEVGMTQIEEEITGLTEFVANLRPENVLEIGTCKGGTFYIWTQLSSGTKISVDLPDGKWGGIGFDDTVRRNEAMNEWGDDIHAILGNSHEQATKDIVKTILGDRKVDFLFIDGDHSYAGVKQDFEMYKEFVKPCGWVAFHDIQDTEHHRSMGVHVGPFWEELKKQYPHKEFNTKSHWAGIGVVQL
jgi:predicted O-methyltransferase YrrM